MLCARLVLLNGQTLKLNFSAEVNGAVPACPVLFCVQFELSKCNTFVAITAKKKGGDWKDNSEEKYQE